MNIYFQLIINIIIAGSVYALVSLSFNLIYKTTKFFNLAHGAMMLVGGYAAFFFTDVLGWGMFGICLGIVISGEIGYWTYKMIFLPLKKRKSSSSVFLIASIGILAVIQACISLLFSNQFHTFSVHSKNISYLQSNDMAITPIQLIIIISFILLAAGALIVQKKTKIGKVMDAIADNERLAKIIGINTDKFIGNIFYVGSAIAGFTGILVGHSSGIEPYMGSNLLFKGIIAAIIGSIGNIQGGILGAFILSVAENFGAWKLSGEWKDVISFSILIIFLLIKPNGIMQKIN